MVNIWYYLITQSFKQCSNDSHFMVNWCWLKLLKPTIKYLKQCSVKHMEKDMIENSHVICVRSKYNNAKRPNVSDICALVYTFTWNRKFYSMNVTIVCFLYHSCSYRKRKQQQQVQRFPYWQDERHAHTHKYSIQCNGM